MGRHPDEFDVPLRNCRGPHLTWDEERIEAAVRQLIGDANEWPRRREFAAAGLSGCYAAIWRSGGVPVWAKRIGVPIPANRG